MPRRAVRNSKRAMGLLSALIAVAAVVALGLVCAIVIREWKRPPQPEATAAPESEAPDATPRAELILRASNYVEPEVVRATPQPGLTATPEPTQAPAATLDASDPYARLRPQPQAANLLPVFSKAYTDQRVIAITVDECSGAKITEEFLDAALEYRARLTLFPTGENIMKAGMPEVLRKAAFQMNCEIENRGYTAMARLFRCIDVMMVQEIWKQSVALNFVLGVKYQPHFLRVYGGVGEYDPRTHAYLAQQGYMGVAHWTVSCTGMKRSALTGKLAPGAIFAFRSTKEDLKLMTALMDAAQEAGYSMVTLNELFGYPSNSYARAEGSLLSETMPPFSYDVRDFYDLYPGEASWSVYNMQLRLARLGYMLEDDVDGIFGEQSTEAMRMFQAQIGRPASGAGDVGTLKRLYAADAPQNPVPLVTPTPGPDDLWEERELIPQEQENDGR